LKWYGNDEAVAGGRGEKRGAASMPTHIINLAEYQAQQVLNRSRKITFHSSVYWDEKGRAKASMIRVRQEDGDTLGILADVMESGGVSQILQDGTLILTPWPCALIEIRDV
jgi:hypothetical protein